MKWILEKDLFYTETHEWGRLEGENVLVVGITDYAQDKLGGVVFVELPEEGKEVEKGESFAIIESVKAVVDSYAPASGKISMTNLELEERPEILNEDPYQGGWMVKIELSDPDELSQLMEEEQYREHLIKEEEKEEEEEEEE